jgi:maleamate amidohydrolase
MRFRRTLGLGLEAAMASKEAFEDHCWKDVMSATDIKLYSPYARETFVGPSVAFLAIDLYNLVYRGDCLG